MNAKLNWTKEAFSREVVILENGQQVGKMQRDAFGQDVEAQLHNTHLLFDVTGFLIHAVTIYDLTVGKQPIGIIKFHFGKRAELHLENGEQYTWKRHNILMRDWNMIREGATDADEREVVSYHLTRQFLADHGDISVETDIPHADIVVLTGLFVRNYFQRRRRMAAAGAAAAS